MLLAAIQAVETTAKASASIEFYAIVIVFGALAVFMIKMAMSKDADDPIDIDRTGK